VFLSCYKVSWFSPSLSLDHLNLPTLSFCFNYYWLEIWEDFGDLRFHLTPLDIVKLGDASMIYDNFSVKVEASFMPPILDEEDLEEYESKVFDHYHKIDKCKREISTKIFCWYITMTFTNRIFHPSIHR
jgi:hypothetical protein